MARVTLAFFLIIVACSLAAVLMVIFPPVIYPF